MGVTPARVDELQRGLEAGCRREAGAGIVTALEGGEAKKWGGPAACVQLHTSSRTNAILVGQSTQLE